jgi:mRNA interferase MazF
MVKQARAEFPSVVRGDVWLVALDPTIGSEVRKSRPCLVVSPPEMHDYLRTVIAAPLTTGNRPAPFRVPVSFGGKDGPILLDQVRTLDKQRLVRRLGSVERGTLRAVLARLRDAFAD